MIIINIKKALQNAAALRKKLSASGFFSKPLTPLSLSEGNRIRRIFSFLIGCLAVSAIALQYQTNSHNIISLPEHDHAMEIIVKPYWIAAAGAKAVVTDPERIAAGIPADASAARFLNRIRGNVNEENEGEGSKFLWGPTQPSVGWTPMLAGSDSPNPGKVRYFSTDGDDSNDGLSPESPKKDFAGFINSTGGGYAVLLRSGDTFFVNKPIVLKSKTVLSSYGGTVRPIISGMQQTTHRFEKASKNADNWYKLQLNGSDVDMGYMVVDGSAEWKQIWEEKDTYPDGAYIFDPRFDGSLYYFTTKNVAGMTAQYSSACHGITIRNCENVRVQGIEIASFGFHGINIGANVDNIQIFGNYIHHIGGAYQVSSNGSYGSRYGNGIQTWLINETNITIADNIVTDCFDAGITPQVNDRQAVESFKHDNDNIVIRNNYIARCEYPIEVFDQQKAYSTKHMYIENNYIVGCCDITEGYRCNAARPSYEGDYGMAQMQLWNMDSANKDSEVYIRNNFCIGSDDYAVLFATDPGDQFIFENNVFITSKGTNMNDFIQRSAIPGSQTYNWSVDKFIYIPKELADAEHYADHVYYMEKYRELLIN